MTWSRSTAILSPGGKIGGGFPRNSQTGPKEDADVGPCLSFIFVSERSALKEAWVMFSVLQALYFAHIMCS